MLNLISDLSEKRGLSYIFISHDLAVVRYISNRIGVMYLGKLVELGDSSEVFGKPAHHYTKALLDAVPVPNPQRRSGTDAPHLQGEIASAIDPPSGCRFRTRCAAVQDICASEEPPLSEISPNHAVACHFPLTRTA